MPEESTEPFFIDERGNEIHVNDLLRVYHFMGARRRNFYMYKVAMLKDGLWIGKDYRSEHTYQLAWCADKNTRLIKGTRVIDRGNPEEDFKL